MIKRIIKPLSLAVAVYILALALEGIVKFTLEAKTVVILL